MVNLCFRRQHPEAHGAGMEILPPPLPDALRTSEERYVTGAHLPEMRMGRSDTVPLEWVDGT
jgi:hypothetical protein